MARRYAMEAVKFMLPEPTPLHQNKYSGLILIETDRMPRRTNRQPTCINPLVSSYGCVHFPKGTIFYHVSTSHLCSIPPNKPILFMTLHPSEWYHENMFVASVELQRDISLLFMVNRIVGFRVISSLNNYLGKENSNLAKMNYENVKCWLPYLKKEGLDGWLSSIENKSAIELAVLPDALKIVECSPLRFNWTNSTYKHNILIPKKWGEIYPVSQSATFTIHRRFKLQIDSYLRKVAEEDPDSTTFSVLLRRSDIEYTDAPIQKITWKTAPTTE